MKDIYWKIIIVLGFISFNYAIVAMPLQWLGFYNGWDSDFYIGTWGLSLAVGLPFGIIGYYYLIIVVLLKQRSWAWEPEKTEERRSAI